jgi:hypothetical protein
VHTNWAAADLDPEKAAVAAAAAAAAGLSAQLGRGQPVEVGTQQPFPASWGIRGMSCGGASACSPLWVSVAAARQQPQEQQEQKGQQQVPPLRAALSA